MLTKTHIYPPFYVTIAQSAIITAMKTKSLQPLRGFNDRYPEDMSILNAIFDTVKSVALLCGFQQYDGPIVEPLELYVGKTSREILEEQAFTLPDKNGNTLMLRPEVTPSLARMIAAKSQVLPMPVRYFNIGLRYRYEAPQRGRNREFYQLDFDIIGSDSLIADIEILNVAIQIFLKLGGTEKDFEICINSRELMNNHLTTFGISNEQCQRILPIIDRKDKVDENAFRSMLKSIDLSVDQIQKIEDFLKNPAEYAKQFDPLLELARQYNIEKYIRVNPIIVRGLDYYTGLVFEVKSKGTLGRSMLGGGRYDNLVGMFNDTQRIPGIGCATSDTILLEFLNEIGKIPVLPPTQCKVLVTIFDETTSDISLKVVEKLRSMNVASMVYPDVAKLQKQIKYADRMNIPYVIIIGPEEREKNVVLLKNMQSGEQEEISINTIATLLLSKLS